jgi:hypothetical protein
MVDSEHTGPENELLSDWSLIAITVSHEYGKTVDGETVTNDNVVSNANPGRKQGPEIAMSFPPPLERKGFSQI